MGFRCVEQCLDFTLAPSQDFVSSALWCYKVPVQHIDAPPVVVPTEPAASTQVHPAWQLVRFGLHLAAVYLTLAQFTVKVCLLTALPFGVVTATLPVFATAGTIA